MSLIFWTIPIILAYWLFAILWLVNIHHYGVIKGIIVGTICGLGPFVLVGWGLYELAIWLLA